MTFTHVRPPVGPPVALDITDFHALFARLSNWSRWGEQDEAGTLNHLTPEIRLAALAGVREGTSVSLAHRLSGRPGPSNPYPFMHGVIPDAEGQLPDGTRYGHHIEFFSMRPHGPLITHVDALCHYRFQGQIYGGRPAPEQPLPQHGTISTMAQGVIARGVLLDVPRTLGLEWLEPGHSVTADVADAVEQAQGVSVRRGDVVLVRTGRRRRERALGAWEILNQLAGVDVRLLPWLREREAAMLGGDGVSDTYPAPTPGLQNPVHILTLVAMGMPLIDNVALEPLAEACARRQQWEFLFVMAPLDYRGGSSSPVNPLAVF